VEWVTRFYGYMGKARFRIAKLVLTWPDFRNF